MKEERMRRHDRFCLEKKLDTSFIKLTQFMGVANTLLIKIAFKSYLSSFSLIFTMANSKRAVYICLFHISPFLVVSLLTLYHTIPSCTRLRMRILKTLYDTKSMLDGIQHTLLFQNVLELHRYMGRSI